MRARGGQAADIALLVVAADAGIQPQTLESIKIIQEENLPFLVAINKVDKPEADVQKVKKELAEINLAPEDFGGEVICVPVSAETGEGIDGLLEMIFLIADMEKDKLKANPQGKVVATVIESHMDSDLGPVCGLIVYNGTLKRGDKVIIGATYGRVRIIRDAHGRQMDKAVPGQPVQICGLKKAPQVGDLLEVVEKKSEFKQRVKNLQAVSHKGDLGKIIKQREERIHDLNFVLRADTLGSLEAVTEIVNSLNHPEVRINILRQGLGEITESDIDLAQSTGARVLSFNTGISETAKKLVRDRNVPVDVFQIIYDLVAKIKEEMNKLLPPEIKEKEIGQLEVLAIFRQGGGAIILGGRVTQGRIEKGTIARVWQKEELKGEGRITQLQKNKQDVEKVKAGSECGIRLEGRVDVKAGDVIKNYQEIKKERTI